MTDLFKIIKERRGWTDEYLAEINNPTHDELKDIDTLADELERIRVSAERITVYPDIDMDGITAGIVSYAGLCQLGFNTAIYRPDAGGGHGFGPDQINDILVQFPDTKAVISCDTGIDSYAGIDAAKRAGLTMIVTDHHKQIEREGNDGYLPADIIVNPMRLDETYSHPAICGAHVMYQVLAHYTKKYQPQQIQNIDLLKLFAGIGTVSDVMPILYENRQLVKDSVSIARLLYVPADDTGWGKPKSFPDVNKASLIRILGTNNHHPVFYSAFRSFALLLACYVQAGKLRTIEDLNEGFYGFYLSPAFNAIRRMITVVDPLNENDRVDLETAFMVFFAQNDSVTIELMNRILQLNEARKQLVEEYAEIILDPTAQQPWAPYVYLTDAPGGMLGLLANKFMHSSGLPTLVLNPTEDGLGGSGRSPGWFPFNSFLNETGHFAAGHEHAFGARVTDADQLTRLVEELDNSIRELMAIAELDGIELQESDADLRLGDGDEFDANYTETDAIFDLIEKLEGLEPYGHEFPAPVIEITTPADLMEVAPLGAGGKHLSITLHNGIKCLYWNAGAKLHDVLALEGDVRIHGAFSTNVFRGVTSINFVVSSIQ